MCVCYNMSIVIKQFTRSQKIMQMSKEKDVQSGKLDILTMAARWNCKIIHVDGTCDNVLW